MLDPRKQSVPSKDKVGKYGEEVFDTIPAGLYPTIGTLLETIFSKVYNNKADPNMLPVKWKVCSISQIDSIYKCAEDEKIIVRAVSRDLKNILRTYTLIDCDQEGGATDPDKGKAKQLKLNVGDKITSRRGKYPVDLTARCFTMFLYCALVQKRNLGRHSDCTVASYTTIFFGQRQSAIFYKATAASTHRKFHSINYNFVEKRNW